MSDTPHATSFDELGLLPELLRAVKESGYTQPTPIQAQAIPIVLSGRDMMGGAQTGTGKTASFTLPILQRLARHANTSASPARHPVRALILAPTRELAAQVEESVKTYAKYLPIKSVQIFGGVNMDPQTQALRSGVEIVVATPGRLLDHVQQRTINLSQVEVLVLDEADRMLDMGFIPDVKRIISLLPKQRQGLLFSATFSDEIKKLADAMLNAPVLIEVARRNAVTELITHIVHPVAREKKRELLVHLIKSRNLNQVLVFCGTRLGTNRLAYQLNHEGVHAAAIHGDKTQSERMQALDEFKTGKVGVLVATDVAARGLDIVELPYVVNFELPSVPEDYVHRIGRTGRAGSTGEAISLVCSEEHDRLGAIEKIIKQSIPQSLVPGFEPNASEVPSYSPGRGREARDGGVGRGRGERPSLTRAERPERSERPAHAERSERPPASSRQAGKPQDPLFSKPYEPQVAPASSQPQQPDAPRSSSRPVRQVAALLGGIRKTP